MKNDMTRPELEESKLREVVADALPELPSSIGWYERCWHSIFFHARPGGWEGLPDKTTGELYTADQMRQYARAAITAAPSPVDGGVEGWTPQLMDELLACMDGWGLILGERVTRDGDSWAWEMKDAAALIRALRTQPKTGGEVECSMCSRWQAVAEAAQLGQTVAERRRGVLDEYVKKMDGIIEEVGGVTASCINPYEDLKRALQGQKSRAETAEAALLAKSAAYDELASGIDLNDHVLVKLNEHGLAILKAQHDELRAAVPSVREWTPPKTDAEGFSKHQLWCLFQDFGPSISLPARKPFDAMRLLVQEGGDDA